MEMNKYLDELRARALDATERWIYQPSEDQIQALMLVQWAYDAVKQQLDALDMLDSTLPPFCAEYWADRAWPPVDVSVVVDDYLGWGWAKQRLDRGGEIKPDEFDS
jgi:hypothetical protein